MPRSRGLNDKQQRFADEYLIDANATQAAIRAGYSARTAGWIGPQLLGKSHVAIEVARQQDARSKKVGVDAERVLRELAALSFYDPADIGSATLRGPKDIVRLPEFVRRAIVGWSWDRRGKFTLKLSAKTPSLDLLARHLGLLEKDNKQRNPLVGFDPAQFLQELLRKPETPGLSKPETPG